MIVVSIYLLPDAHLYIRAGANFSAISASDNNALRWDRLGYRHLLKLAAEDGANAFVQETPSTEYWDEMPSREKINSMAGYLKDVSIFFNLHSGFLQFLTKYRPSLKKSPRISFQLAFLSVSHSSQLPSTLPCTFVICS